LPAIIVGIVNASGGGLLRDVLVREEPLLFKPGQVYVLAALAGACLFTFLIMNFHEPVETAGLLAVGATFLLRILAIIFNWKTRSVRRSIVAATPPPAAADSTNPGAASLDKPAASSSDANKPK
jgi:uncharacterized membrane protein YeiH